MGVDGAVSAMRRSASHVSNSWQTSPLPDSVPVYTGLSAPFCCRKSEAAAPGLLMNLPSVRRVSRAAERASDYFVPIIFNN